MFEKGLWDGTCTRSAQSNFRSAACYPQKEENTMFKKKHLILLIVLTILLVNTGMASALVSAPEPQPVTLALAVKISPVRIYPPLVIFTATLSRVPPMTFNMPVVDFFTQVPVICQGIESTDTGVCGSPVSYLGSAKFNPEGQAILSKQMKPGTYTAIARTQVNGAWIFSNELSFEVP
jgi:hypothetical protein